MRKRRTPKYPRKSALNTTEFVFQILTLLTQRASAAFWSNTLNRISHTLNPPRHALRHNREISRQCAVIIDHKHVFEILSSIASDELRHDFRADGRPDEVDAVRTADFFGVVEGGWAVAVADDEDVLGREDF